MKTKLKCKWCRKEIKNRRHEALCSQRPEALDTPAPPEVIEKLVATIEEAREPVIKLEKRNPEDSPLKKFRCLRECFVWNRYFVKDAIYDIPCEMDIEPKNFVPYEEGG